MKNIIQTFVISLLISLSFVSCEDWTEVRTDNLQDIKDNSQNHLKTPEYWANLRAYKRSNHAKNFGWFGWWDGGGVSMHGRSALSSVPDSVDIISVFGEKYAWNLNDMQKKDLKYVQEVKGTRVVLQQLIEDVNFGLPQTEEGALMYANALCDTVYKYGYDGLELGYEPNWGGDGYISSNQELMFKFVSEIGKRVGPLSGTGKLFIIDGEGDFLLPKAVPYFDYAMSQAYAAPNDAELQRRFNSHYKIGWKPEQFFVTEEFQLRFSTGGTPYTLPNGTVTVSSLGMAQWNPTQGRKGGSGTYHMEFDYANTPDYKYTRESIQIMNPAVK